MSRNRKPSLPSLDDQARLYVGAASVMDWDSYVAATAAFYSTSDYHRPCRNYADGGRREDAFHMASAERKGIVFG